MSPKRHLSIALALVFVGFGVGFFGLGFSLLNLLRDVPEYVQFLILMMCGMIAFYIVKKFVQKLSVQFVLSANPEYILKGLGRFLSFTGVQVVDIKKSSRWV